MAGSRKGSPGAAARFDYALAFDRIDFRKRPDLYRLGRGEQGVLLVEPYKSEILPLWRFRTPELARQSSAAILRRFRAYGRKRDFVGMDGRAQVPADGLYARAPLREPP